MPAIKTLTIDDLLDAKVEICRDERCPIIEVHAVHGSIPSTRGRAPKSCPICFKPIPLGQGARCLMCGWDRKGPTAMYGRKRNSNA